MKKVSTLNVVSQSIGVTEPKGSASNPYTLDEYEKKLNEGTWTGGFVEGVGYCLGEVFVLYESSCYGTSGEQIGSNSSIENNHANEICYINPNIVLHEGRHKLMRKSHIIMMNLPSYKGDIYITSTARTPEEQARAMLNNIKKNGIQSQLKLYGEYGDMVIRVYDSSKSDYENVYAMTKIINEVGPGKVSKHCADRSVLDVFDVSIRYLSDVEVFKNALKERGIKNIPESENGCIHIEIPQ